MKRISTDPTEYVVFDVETNGLKSKRNDLLSISFYKPDDGKEYSKFLPLELNRKVLTTHINGITENDLVGATALTQKEYNKLVKEFELEKRTILIYAGSNFDSSFLSQYMKRHHIIGFDKLHFYNIKHNVISSRYSFGNITKDNLCRVFNIEGVEDIHNGLNDCKLEWNLFKKMNGFFYLVTEGKDGDKVFRLNDEYIIPAGLLSSHPNLNRILENRPFIECKSFLVKSFEIEAKGIEKFPTNFTGMTIEHLINTMLDVYLQDNDCFLIMNKSKLDYIGRIPNGVSMIPMSFNSDGTVTAIHKEDRETEIRINSTTVNIKKQIQPLINFIKFNIFKNKTILSQELVIDSVNNILALCDLSTKDAILEIKTNNYDSLTYKEQLFYEANGRDVYHLKMEWIEDENTNLLKKIIFHIYSVDVHVGTANSKYWTFGKREELRHLRFDEIKKSLLASEVSLVSFSNVSSPIKIQCKVCGYEWNVGYKTLQKKIPQCPECKRKFVTNKNKISKEEQIKLRADKYYKKVVQRSNNTITVTNYVGSKFDIDAVCMICGHKWKIRADHLIERCWCPNCKKQTIN